MDLKAKILAASDLPQEAVAVSEWDCTVHIRTLTAAQRDKFEEMCSVNRYGNVRARLVALCMVDDGGQRIFADKEIDALGDKSGRVLDRLFEVASRMNGFSAADAEELEKN